MPASFEETRFPRTREKRLSTRIVARIASTSEPKMMASEIFMARAKWPNVEAVYPASRGLQGWKNTEGVNRGLRDTLLLN